MMSMGKPVVGHRNRTNTGNGEALQVPCSLLLFYAVPLRDEGQSACNFKGLRNTLVKLFVTGNSRFKFVYLSINY